MKRITIAIVLVAVVVSVVVGTSALRRDDIASTALPPAPPVPGTVTTVPTPAKDLLLVWVPGGLPAGFADRVRTDAGLGAVTVVLGDTVQLASTADADGVVVDRPSDGRTIPLDAIAIDCDSWSGVASSVDAAAVCGLASDEALLGATSARLRRLSEDATMVLSNGRTLRVAGIVADHVVGGAELVVPAASADATGVDTERYVLATYEGGHADAEARVRALTDVGVRVRGSGETPWLRHGDFVLPQALLKEVFGEFASRSTGDGRLVIDPTWESANLVVEELPLLGSARCHRALVPALRGALAEIAERGLLTSLDRGAAGCWNPRVIAGTDQPSRHAWGAAVDLLPFPSDPDTVTAIVAVMKRWGFTWGGRWVLPDPPHFEYVRAAG